MTLLPGLNFILDVYPQWANSAVASTNALRCLAAAVAPITAPQMFHKLGVAWASATLGFVSLVLVPAPLYLYMRGRKIQSLNQLTIPQLPDLAPLPLHPAKRARSSWIGQKLSLQLEMPTLDFCPSSWYQNHV